MSVEGKTPPAIVLRLRTFLRSLLQGVWILLAGLLGGCGASIIALTSGKFQNLTGPNSFRIQGMMIGIVLISSSILFVLFNLIKSFRRKPAKKETTVIQKDETKQKPPKAKKVRVTRRPVWYQLFNFVKGVVNWLLPDAELTGMTLAKLFLVSSYIAFGQYSITQSVFISLITLALCLVGGLVVLDRFEDDRVVDDNADFRWYFAYAAGKAVLCVLSVYLVANYVLVSAPSVILMLSILVIAIAWIKPDIDVMNEYIQRDDGEGDFAVEEEEPVSSSVSSTPAPTIITGRRSGAGGTGVSINEPPVDTEADTASSTPVRAPASPFARPVRRSTVTAPVSDDVDEIPPIILRPIPQPVLTGDDFSKIMINGRPMSEDVQSALHDEGIITFETLLQEVGEDDGDLAVILHLNGVKVSPALMSDITEQLSSLINTVVPAAPPVNGDKLTMILGVSQEAATRLAMRGIDTFVKLADCDADFLEVILKGVPDAKYLGTWAGQASFAAHGMWDQLKAYQQVIEGMPVSPSTPPTRPGATLVDEDDLDERVLPMGFADEALPGELLYLSRTALNYLRNQTILTLGALYLATDEQIWRAAERTKYRPDELVKFWRRALDHLVNHDFEAYERLKEDFRPGEKSTRPIPKS